MPDNPLFTDRFGDATIDFPSEQSRYDRLVASGRLAPGFDSFLAYVSDPYAYQASEYRINPDELPDSMLGPGGQLAFTGQSQLDPLGPTGSGGDGILKGSPIRDLPPTIPSGPVVVPPGDGLLPAPPTNPTVGTSVGTQLPAVIPEIVAPVESVALGGSSVPSAGMDELAQQRIQIQKTDPIGPIPVGSIPTPSPTIPAQLATVVGAVAPSPIASLPAAPISRAVRTPPPRFKPTVVPAGRIVSELVSSAPSWSSSSVPCIPKEVLADFMKGFKKKKRCP